MTTIHDDEDGLTELSNRKMLGILMQEIADVRLELKDDIRRLDGKIDGVAKDLQIVKSDLQTLRLEVHHNQTTFIRNHENHEKRIKVLEAAAA